MIGSLWVAWLYGAPFAVILAAELWLNSLVEPKDGWKYPHKAIGGLLTLAMIGVAAWGSYAINQAPSRDCPATYDRQGIHRDC